MAIVCRDNRGMDKNQCLFYEEWERLFHTFILQKILFESYIHLFHPDKSIIPQSQIHELSLIVPSIPPLLQNPTLKNQLDQNFIIFLKRNYSSELTWHFEYFLHCASSILKIKTRGFSNFVDCVLKKLNIDNEKTRDPLLCFSCLRNSLHPGYIQKETKHYKIGNQTYTFPKKKENRFFDIESLFNISQEALSSLKLIDDALTKLGKK